MKPFDERGPDCLSLLIGGSFTPSLIYEDTPFRRFCCLIQLVLFRRYNPNIYIYGDCHET
jgi:hypothetical protein